MLHGGGNPGGPGAAGIMPPRSDALDPFPSERQDAPRAAVGPETTRKYDMSDEQTYFHPDTDELVTLGQIGELPHPEQVELVLGWFRKHYKESDFTHAAPDDDTPSDPHAVQPIHEMLAEFGHYVAQDVLDEVCGRLETERYEWVPKDRDTDEGGGWGGSAEGGG